MNVRFTCAECGAEISEPATGPCECGGKLWEDDATREARLAAEAESEAR